MPIDPFFGSVISAGASLIGSKMSADASAKAARMNAIAQANEAEAARVYNERMYDRSLIETQKERDLQKEFAQTGIRWRAADAQAAGIHPLAALGAQTISYSPVSISAPPTMPRANVAPFSGASMGSGIAAAGQDISRGIHASRNEQQRDAAYAKTIQDLSLQRMGLENELLSSQIRKVNQPGTPPAFPSDGPRLLDGQGNSPLVKTDAMKRTASVPDNPSQEPAPITDIGYAASGGGGFAIVPSKDAKERIEDMSLYEAQHFIRNNLLPFFSNRYFNPPPDKPSFGREWYINPFTGEYRQRKIPSSHSANPSWYRRGPSSASP